MTTATPSVSQSMAAVKKTLLKRAGSLLTASVEDKPNPQEALKQELDEVVKAVEERRRHLGFLDMEISKNKSSKVWVM